MESTDNAISSNDQLSVINSHIKNVNYSLYSFNLSVKEENAKTAPDANIIASLNFQIAESEKILALLNTELATVSATVVPPVAQ
jgi:hypothetical protein